MSIPGEKFIASFKLDTPYPKGVKPKDEPPPVEKPKELPALSEPDPNQFDIHEYQRLLEQKERTDARLKELDAHPDKDKIIAFPNRI